ncbi:hypothetical protein BDA96_01G475500 [Sorghum bicolor]|uniref:Uncharacterized protein n=1 Tax=Sorghum bicolor TaxID=4558 RepID=A0A921S7R3_SORBI|nr:hypothetical protein BDA96_01G475500 [Sorghum bicolor]
MQPFPVREYHEIGWLEVRETHGQHEGDEHSGSHGEPPEEPMV